MSGLCVIDLSTKLRALRTSSNGKAWHLCDAILCDAELFQWFVNYLEGRVDPDLVPQRIRAENLLGRGLNWNDVKQEAFAIKAAVKS